MKLSIIVFLLLFFKVKLQLVMFVAVCYKANLSFAKDRHGPNRIQKMYKLICTSFRRLLNYSYFQQFQTVYSTVNTSTTRFAF